MNNPRDSFIRRCWGDDDFLHVVLTHLIAEFLSRNLLATINTSDRNYFGRRPSQVNSVETWAHITTALTRKINPWARRTTTEHLYRNRPQNNRFFSDTLKSDHHSTTR